VAGLDTPGFRPTIENVADGNRSGPVVEVLAAVFTVRPLDTPGAAADGPAALHVLLWQRAQAPDAGRWALPGGPVLADEDVDSSTRRQLAEKVDLTRVAHLEQTGVFSAPDRVPHARVVASGFLGLVPQDPGRPAPRLPADTAWHPVDHLPATAFDHGGIVEQARQRLRGKLSYTNIGFALAPAAFTMAELSRIYTATLGHEVDVTNLYRILHRRGMLTPTGRTAPPGPSGGRPAALYRFAVQRYRVTDPFAAFRPPS
jgi:8-oxo-dGTP diphosphatase